MPATPARPAPERILVRGVNWLGDAVMTTPALQRLREAHPLAHIALFTASKLAGLWKHHPDLDQVITFEPGESVWSVARRLRPLDFTTALVLPNSPRSALEMFLARIPCRIGHARPWRNWLLTHRVTPPEVCTPMRKRSPAEIQRLIAALPVRPGTEGSSSPALRAPSPPSDGGEGRGEEVPGLEDRAMSIDPHGHHIHLYLNLAAALGSAREPVAPRLAVTAAEVDAIRLRFGFARGAGGQRSRLLGINAGAEYGPAKRWPRERFIAAANLVRAEIGCDCWIFGGPAEVDSARDLAEALAQTGPPDSVRCLAGQTSLRELCAALRACDAILTNDSGPMHVAAAVGTPVIVPFGSTSPGLTGPGLPGGSGEVRHQVLTAGAPCSPCFRRECPIDFRCMTGIPAGRAAEAVLKAMKGTPTGS